MSDYNMLINKYRALAAIYAFLKMLIVFLQLLIPFSIVFFYFHPINLWYIIAGIIVYALGCRRLWVILDGKSRTYAYVYLKYKKEKAEMMASIFR